MNLDEVGSEKVRAILIINKNRDIFDLYFLVNGKKIVFKPELINKKLEFYKKRFSIDSFIHELNSRSQRFEKDLKNLVFGELPDYKSVVKALVRSIYL